MKKILFICGSLNQTTMMHKISKYFEKEYQCFFTQYYTDGLLDYFRKFGLLNFSILGGKFFRQTTEYLNDNLLVIDYQGKFNDYNLVFTCSDLLVPKNIRNTPVILVQEGMTDPENFMYHIVKYLGLPRFLASTSTNGLSDLYNIFCVASEGYKDHFIKKGVKKEKIRVTGIPNFDDVKRHLNNDFPYKDFVLVATSDARETFKYENRKAFIKKAVQIADGRQLIFKLHPNENIKRARKEIERIAPKALVYYHCDINPMIANCSVLITRYSTVVYIGIALGKVVHSEFDLEQLQQMVPIQNDGISAENIAGEAKVLLRNRMESTANKLVFENNKMKSASFSYFRGII